MSEQPPLAVFAWGLAAIATGMTLGWVLPLCLIIGQKLGFW